MRAKAVNKPIAKKYLLNKKDALRFHALALRESVGSITMKERAELQRLDNKRDRLLCMDPIIRVMLEQQKRRHRETNKLIRRLQKFENDSRKARLVCH